MTLSYPTQAVILAGGRGARLRPLTDTVPKPMIRFHGRPFLEYLIEQLRDQGVDDVLLLVGYLAERIREYFGDGAPWGLRIRYVESPVEAETGRRILDASPLLDSHFLLLYCDNYWPMNLELMWHTFTRTRGQAMVTVYANRDGYTRNNVMVDDEGRVVVYDPERAANGLNGVDIGYAVLSREALAYLPADNVRFEHVVYSALASRRLLQAYQTEHRYYSVGTHDRLPLTEAFFAPQRAVIFDLEAVVNTRLSRSGHVRNREGFEWLPGAVETLGMLNRAGYKLIVTTEWPGTADGTLTEMAVEALRADLQVELSEAGAGFDAIYLCPHGRNERCTCRKPSPGLLYQAQRDFHLDLTRTLYIGADERDIEAGQAAGCPAVLVSRDNPLQAAVQRYISAKGRKVGV